MNRIDQKVRRAGVIIRSLKNKLKNEKGSSVLEFAIGLLVFVLMTAFVVDLLLVGQKRFMIARDATDIARVMAVQGGVNSVTPKGYPGGSKAYATSANIYKLINSKMIASDIKSDEWSATLTEYDKSGKVIKRVPLSPTTSFKVDYMNSLDIEIHAKYNWHIMRQITGGLLDEANVGAKRHAVSEFKYNFDNWEGEQY